MNNIKMARLFCEMSQIELCFRANIKRYRLSEIERGAAEPTTEEIDRIDAVLNKCTDLELNSFNLKRERQDVG